jgi:DNA-binding beta-propeller fold protein YncE
LEVSQFRNPSQIYSDADGNIYVADCSNHCIRRITPEKMVETVLGMPGTAGWRDGGKAEALFNLPRGLGISKDGSIYVADLGNARVRKLSIN